MHAAELTSVSPSSIEGLLTVIADNSAFRSSLASNDSGALPLVAFGENPSHLLGSQHEETVFSPDFSGERASDLSQYAAGVGEWYFKKPSGDPIGGIVKDVRATGVVELFYPLIAEKLDFPLSETQRDNVIPNSRDEGGLEQSYGVARGGALLGTIGGFDFLASLAANGRHDLVVGYDYNPHQIVASSIRAAIAVYSPTPAAYLGNLLSIEVDEQEDDLAKTFQALQDGQYSEEKHGRNRDAILHVLSLEDNLISWAVKRMWGSIQYMYHCTSVSKRSIVTGKSINYHQRNLEDVNLRVYADANRGSWLSSQENYDFVRTSILNGRWKFIQGNLFTDVISRGSKLIQQHGSALSTLYVSNILTFTNPSESEMEAYRAEKELLLEEGVSVIEGSPNRGLTYNSFDAYISELSDV